ncbi:MAG: polysaccharide biosynthesis tyrosine autokinase, partial [Candidatus Fimenecus sp.]
MEYNAKNAPEEKGIELKTIMHYINRILQKWWAVLLCAVIFAGIGFGVAKFNYVPKYSCSMRFAIDNKNANTQAGGQSASDLNAGISLAKNYQIIMTDTESLMDLVAKNSNYNINGRPLTGADVKGMISSSLIEDTAIISITVTTSDPEASYAVATSYVNNYTQITDKAYQNTRAILYDPPVKPTSPNGDNSVMLYTILGFIVGAALVVAIICIEILIKDTVKDSDEITNKLDSKVIGSVVSIKKNDKKNSKQSILITDRKSGFMFIESFKLIRTKIENVAKRKNYKAFVFTSAAENEGKTTVSTNTALALAKNGKSVLLIDADLRKPSVYKALGISAANELGLAGVVRGERTLSDSIKYFEKFNLFLLVTSQPVAESTEILSADETAEIIEAVKNEFDYIIIDTPPGGLVADASIMAGYADACVMVVRSDWSPLRRIKRTMEDLSGTGAEVVGCVY